MRGFLGRRRETIGEILVLPKNIKELVDLCRFQDMFTQMNNI